MSPDIKPSYAPTVEKAQITDKIKRAIEGAEITNQQMFEIIVDIAGNMSNQQWGFDEIQLHSPKGAFHLGFVQPTEWQAYENAWLETAPATKTRERKLYNFRKSSGEYTAIDVSLEEDTEKPADLTVDKKRVILKDLLEAFSSPTFSEVLS